MNPGLKILLLPFAFIYGLITLIRNRLYDTGFLKVTKFDIHTIGVGNLSVGGAGKTPLVEYLIRLLREEEPKLATLSRGYKRKTSDFVLADDNSTAEDIGDEPLIYKYKYKIQVAVDGNRVNGVKKLIALETSLTTSWKGLTKCRRSLQAGKLRRPQRAASFSSIMIDRFRNGTTQLWMN